MDPALGGYLSVE